jgi:hypothetical protein
VTKETTRLKLPYPEDTDAPNAPAQIKALDELVEKYLLRGGQLLQVRNAAEQSISTSPGTYQELGTPDKTGKLKIATGGLIVVEYEALWKESVKGIARAAIHINGVQLKAAMIAASAGTPQTVAGMIPTASSNANRYCPLISSPIGLVGGSTGAEAGHTLVATGMASAMIANPSAASTARFAASIGTEQVAMGEGIAGGPCVIRDLPEGEYEISVRYMITEAGSVTAKERRLTAYTREAAP